MTYTELFRELVRAEIELWDAVDDHLRSVAGVSVSQFQALAAVGALDGSARVQDISADMSITVGATSKLVDRLARDGLVSRQSNPTDRRSSIILLSEKGRQAVDAASRAAEQLLSQLLTGLAPLPLAEELQKVRALIGTRS